MLVASGGVRAATTTGPTPAAEQTLTIFAAGTLAAPFHAIDDAFEHEHPEVSIRAQFGGSVKMVKQVTDLHEQADVVAVADYGVIPKYLFAKTSGTGRDAASSPGYADWYVGFAGNAITFVHTPRSKYANALTPRNWYDVLARRGVQIGRSNPDTDPSGYQTLQMLELAARYYHKPNLPSTILANAPPSNVRDTETELIGALESGQIDYLAIYRSDAKQHGFAYLDLPPQINLTDLADAAEYATVSVTTANGTLKAKPIVYAFTIPRNAQAPRAAQAYARFLLGSTGRKIMADHGFITFARGEAVNIDNVPAVLRPLVRAWTPPS